MRIAVYHNLPSGGGKRALFEITRRMAEEHAVDVYSLSTADHEFCDLRPYCDQHVVFPFDPLPLAQSPFGRLNQGIRALDLLRLRSLQRRIAQRIDLEGYDAVFAHNCRYGQSPSVLGFLETPTVYYCAEPPRSIYEPPVPRPYNTFSAGQRLGNVFDPLPGIYRAVLTREDRANVSAADIVLVNSCYSRESLYRVYGVFARVCYLGVDTERFRPLGLPEQHFVLSVGSLNPRKGFEFLVRGLAALDPARRSRLVIVSNGVDNRELQYLDRLSDQLDVEVEFRTLVSDKELVMLYNQAMLTVYAPIMEPFGLVPLESMACGTPVVGVHEAGVRESIIDGVTGLLIDREREEFATAVRSLLADEERRTRYGSQAREYVLASWTWDTSVTRIDRILTEAARQQ